MKKPSAYSKAEGFFLAEWLAAGSSAEQEWLNYEIPDYDFPSMQVPAMR